MELPAAVSSTSGTSQQGEQVLVVLAHILGVLCSAA